MKKYLTIILVCLSYLATSSFTWSDRNVIYVLANTNDKLLLEKEYVLFSDLTDSLKIRINNSENNPNYPEMKVKHIELLGDIQVSKSVVSIANDRGTSYEFYIKVHSEIERTYNELRDEFATKHFRKKYKLLEDSKKNAVNKAIPKRISEAEPRNYNKK